MTARDRLLATLRQETDFLCALATVDGQGQPHVRYMRGMIDDDLCIRCPTFVSTRKVSEIQDHPTIALTCGDVDSSRPGTYFQIQGRAEILQEDTDRRAAWTPRLEKWFSGTDDPSYAVIRIQPTCIEAFPIGGGPSAERWIASPSA